MKSSTNHNIKHRETSKDVFYTPLELVKTHLEQITPYNEENFKIFEPFFGSGRYYNEYKNYFNKNNTFDWCEIEKEKDFFKYDKKVDIIVSNPPYSILDDVLDHSTKLNPKIISYLIGVNNLTPKRIEFMNSKGYKIINIHFCKVYKWFGMSIIATFSKDGINCISYDRKIYKEETPEKKERKKRTKKDKTII
jgi:hypothetical protein